MTWVRVSKEEMARIRAMAASKKAKRAAKAVILWPNGARAVIGSAGEKDKARGRKKKTLRQLAVDRLDGLWSLAVRRRDAALYGPLCRVCHRAAAVCGYHLVPKKRGYLIRWDLDNGCGGCSPCNMGERMNPLLYREKHISIFGRDRIEAIEARAKGISDFSMDDLKAIGAWLSDVIKRPAGAIPPPAPACMSAV